MRAARAMGVVKTYLNQPQADSSVSIRKPKRPLSPPVKLLTWDSWASSNPKNHVNIESIVPKPKRKIKATSRNWPMLGPSLAAIPHPTLTVKPQRYKFKYGARYRKWGLELRLLYYVAAALLVVGVIYVVDMLLKVLSIAFAPGFNPIAVDFSGVSSAASVVFAALIVALIILILLDYIPGAIRGEEV